MIVFKGGKLMNIPNILSIIRLGLIPLFIFLFFSAYTNSLIYAIIIFLISGITDVLDGYIARKFNLITKLGTVLDPLADKLMLITVLLCLGIKSYIPLWLPIIVIIKEISMICGGFFLYNKDTVVPSNIFGKLATFLFYVSISILYFNNKIGLYMLYASLIATLIAFISYLTKYIELRKYENKGK